MPYEIPPYSSQWTHSQTVAGFRPRYSKRPVRLPLKAIKAVELIHTWFIEKCSVVILYHKHSGTFKVLSILVAFFYLICYDRLKLITGRCRARTEAFMKSVHRANTFALWIMIIFILGSFALSFVIGLLPFTLDSTLVSLLRYILLFGVPILFYFQYTKQPVRHTLRLHPIRFRQILFPVDSAVSDVSFLPVQLSVSQLFG